MRKLGTLLSAALLVMGLSGAALAAEAPGTVISNELSASITAEAPPPAQLLELSWDLQADETVAAGEENQIIVTARSAEGLTDPIEGVLYVLEITDANGDPVSQADGAIDIEGPAADGSPEPRQSLGYDADDDFWFWGSYNPASNTGGFTWTPGGDADGAPTTFHYTIHTPGTYDVKLYAVQLP